MTTTSDPTERPQTSAAPITFRQATAADLDRICEIMSSDPGEEAVGLCFGRRDLAQRLNETLIRLPNSPMGWQRTVLAELDGEALGVLQASAAQIGFDTFFTPGILLRVLLIFGPVRFAAGLPRMRARSHVDVDHPAGAYVVHELHVDMHRRNQGVGGAMLRYAEDEARRLGHTQMSLTTTTANPARRLYGRHGYRVVETRTDPDYERYTGIEGRYLMVKELS